ncbi:hypothetical protein RFI_33475, partial [Reticulomyxa filosa]
YIYIYIVYIHKTYILYKFITYKVDVHREQSAQPSSVELVVVPDSNIDDIGIEYKDELHICCTQQLVEAGKCNKEDLDRLILKKDVSGLYRYDITFDQDSKDSSILV